MAESVITYTKFHHKDYIIVGHELRNYQENNVENAAMVFFFCF